MGNNGELRFLRYFLLLASFAMRPVLRRRKRPLQRLQPSSAPDTMAAACWPARPVTAPRAEGTSDVYFPRLAGSGGLSHIPSWWRSGTGGANIRRELPAGFLPDDYLKKIAEHLPRCGRRFRRGHSDRQPEILAREKRW